MMKTMSHAANAEYNQVTQKMKSMYYPVYVFVLFTFAKCLFLPVTVVSGDDEDYVTCGSVIKLTNMETGSHYLASAQHKINSGSNQQLITSSPTRTESDLLWIISTGHGMTDCEPGTKIAFGSKIRFTHMNTGSNLHSHLMRSPLANNQEVTGFGDDGNGDSGDNWVVNPVRGFAGSHWTRNQIVTISHSDTGKNLGSSQRFMFTRNNCGNRCPVMNHLEVFAASGGGSTMQWKAEHGVYLSI